MRYNSAAVRPAKTSATSRERPASEEAVGQLAQFRYALRKFLRFSENAARQHGVTPQQHQLMLGVAGFTGRGSATVSELAEFLQERPHSVVGLIERATQHGLVRRTQDKSDRRVVNVSLTASGKRILSRLTELHQGEARRIQEFSVPAWRPARTPTVSAAPKRLSAGHNRSQFAKDGRDSGERNEKKQIENK